MRQLYMDNWINVRQRLPVEAGECEWVFVQTKGRPPQFTDKQVRRGYYDWSYRLWMVEGSILNTKIFEVTHWHNEIVPKPPKEDQ